MTNKTTVTELATALGIAGGPHPSETLGLMPGSMTGVDTNTWASLCGAFRDEPLAEVATQAFENGQFFLNATAGLRGRHPRLIEWVGPRRVPGDEVTPSDLRIDHVYLVSCKYLSKITVNASPSHVFERLLTGGHGRRSPNWFAATAPEAYREFWEASRRYLGDETLPSDPDSMSRDRRKRVAKLLASRVIQPELADYYRALCSQVSEASARAWRTNLSSDTRAPESMLWRMLRIGSAPYFVLGSHGSTPMRLRVATPWDWRNRYEFLGLDITGGTGGQPTVDWSARFKDCEDPTNERVVTGHVEVRWSHGRFSGPPEAKVYLDTAFADVPGYWDLR